MQISFFFERLKSVRNDLILSLHSTMVNLKEKSESLIKYYIKVTCAFKWARKWPRKTVSYESAKCVPYNTNECNHNGFVSDLRNVFLGVAGYCSASFSILCVLRQAVIAPGVGGGWRVLKKCLFFTKRGTPFPYLVYDFVSLSTMVWVLFSVFSVLCITSVGDRNRLRFWIKPLKRPIWAWPKLFWPLKETMLKHRQYIYFYIFSRATLNDTFTAKYDGVLPRTA